MTTAHKHASAAGMTKAAKRFVESLSGDQRDKTIYEYMDGERIFWYYPPVNRHGIPLRDMDDDQRQLAYTLMETGLTGRSFDQAKLIIEHESVLGPLEKEAGVRSFVRDPDLYYWTVFGDPGSDKEPWGWRVEGHHISLNFSLWGDKFISMTPFFFGANPAEVRKGPKKGLRILDQREDLAYELMNSLDKGQTSKATIYAEAPYDILTYNASRVSLPAEEGLPASKMNDTQKDILRNLVNVYVNQVRTDMAQEKLQRLEEEGFDGLHWAWGGPLEEGKEHYYRIHGGNFVVEFDNRQNGANHIHSVWRDVENDFANDVLREHLLLYHVL
ncbi:MAG: DUF3500 domain-containing protein [Dehalococcoidia bacterium]|nr:DUF3500 domain-containing protein [Dehalococcoidia bacterium]